MRTQLFWYLYSLVYDYAWGGPILDRLRSIVATEAAGARLVVDLGCGTGSVTAPICLFAKVIGVDNSPAMLRLARRQGLMTIERDAAHSQLPDGCADVVVVTNLLQVHPDPPAVLFEAQRLLRDGGSLILSWPVDGLTPRRMLKLDRDAGRPWWSRRVADLLRRLITLLGGLTAADKVRLTRSEVDLEARLRTAIPNGAISTQLVGSAQRIFRCIPTIGEQSSDSAEQGYCASSVKPK